jgi:putative NIF3 family GTP cyclohydrolase 1 type 2
MRHHEVLSALARGCGVLLAGHTNTERGYLPILAERLRNEVTGLDAVISRLDRDPLRAG